jgi:hypothetical protein
LVTFGTRIKRADSVLFVMPECNRSVADLQSVICRITLADDQKLQEQEAETLF